MNQRKKMKDKKLSPLQTVMTLNMANFVKEYNATVSSESEKIPEITTYEEKEKMHNDFFSFCRSELSKDESINDIIATFKKFLAENK